MDTTPEIIETYSESIRSEIRLNGIQVQQLLDEHGLTRDHWFHRRGIDYDHVTDTWSADDVLAWLGY